MWLVSHEEWQITSQGLMFTLCHDCLETVLTSQNQPAYGETTKVFCGRLKTKRFGNFPNKTRLNGKYYASQRLSVQYLQSGQRSTGNIERWGGGAENGGKQPLETLKAWDNITIGTGENK